MWKNLSLFLKCKPCFLFSLLFWKSNLFSFKKFNNPKAILCSLDLKVNLLLIRLRRLSFPPKDSRVSNGFFDVDNNIKVKAIKTFLCFARILSRLLTKFIIPGQRFLEAVIDLKCLMGDMMGNIFCFYQIWLKSYAHIAQDLLK